MVEAIRFLPTSVGELDCAPDPWIFPGSALGVACIWKVAGEWKLSVCLSPSLFASENCILGTGTLLKQAKPPPLLLELIGQQSKSWLLSF